MAGDQDYRSGATGGAAFPFAATDYAGMSLRDWFAGQLIVGMIRGPCDPDDDDYFKQAAEAAYLVADAMLAARGK